MAEPIDVHVVGGGTDWLVWAGFVVGIASLIVAGVTLWITIRIARTATEIETSAYAAAERWRQEDLVIEEAARTSQVEISLIRLPSPSGGNFAAHIRNVGQVDVLLREPRLVSEGGLNLETQGYGGWNPRRLEPRSSTAANWSGREVNTFLVRESKPRDVLKVAVFDVLGNPYVSKPLPYDLPKN